MNTCSGCKNWTEYTDGFVIKYCGPDQGADAIFVKAADYKIKNRGLNVGECGSKKIVYEKHCPEDGLSYWDGGHGSAVLKTGGNFGCIHWEQKS